jgi:hypothetical protein
LRIIPFIANISNSKHDLNKALEMFVSYSDSHSFTSAGIQLGRIKEIAENISNICTLAEDALWEDSQTYKAKTKT